MLYLELETVLARTPPKPPGPSGFDAFLPIAQRGIPFTSVGGRAFMTIPAQSFGYRTLPIRSRVCRPWFSGQSLSNYQTIHPRRRPGDRPVCVTKSPAISVTHSGKGAYAHTRNPSASRSLRHSLRHNAPSPGRA